MQGSRLLFSFFSRYRRQLALGLLLVACMAFTGLLGPLVVGQAVDRLRQDISRELLLTYAALLVGIAAVQGLFSFGQRTVLVRLSRQVEMDLRGQYFGHLTRMPQSFFHDHPTGDLMARATNDMEAVRMLFGPAVMYSANAVFATTGALLIMGGLHLALTFVVLCTLPLVAIATRQFGARIHAHFLKVQDQFSILSTKVQENFSGARVVRAYTQERAEVAAFHELNEEYLERNRRLIRWQVVFHPLLQLLVGLSFVWMIAYGGLLAWLGEISVGELVEFHLLLGRIVWPMIAFGFVINLVQRGRASLSRIQRVLDTPAAIHDEQVLPAEKLPVEIAGEVSFRHLSFAYQDGQEPVLKDIDVHVPAGTVVALIGRTGAGKSTLLSLPPRLVDPPVGQLLVDGVDVRGFPLETLRSAIAFVPQETFLFSATLRENIAFGDEAAEDAAILEAARLAGLDDDLQGFPKGLDTLVGERGITLSGGQKQRVALARAILRRPRLLLLDDCLSAVDTHTEERILGNLGQVFKGRTVLMVSHRVSTVRHADLILVLDDGRIAERGSHEELLAAGGLYADLERRQALEEELATA